MDNLPGTSGDDTFIGGSAQIQAADVIDGKGGNDVAKLYLDTADAGLNSTNVEEFQIQVSGGVGRTFTATNVEGAKAVWSNESTQALTVENLQNNVALGLNQTNAALNASFKAGVIGAAETLTLATNASGTKDVAAAVTVNDGGTSSKFTTLDVNAVAGKSFINVVGSTGAAGGNVAANNTVDFTTLKTSGEGTVNLAAAAVPGNTADAFNNLTTVELNAAGGSTVNLGANAKAVKVTGGAGNDTVQFAVGEFNTQDVINLGAGTNTLVVGDADLTGAATTDLTKAINAAKGVTTLATSATGAVAINAGRYAEIDAFAVGLGGAVTGAVGTAAVVGPPAVAAAAGTAAVTVSGIAASGDSLQVQNDLTGGAGAAGTDGGAGLSLRMATDGAADSFTLSVAENAATISGGVKGTGADGAGIDAREIETLTISVSKDLTISGAGTAVDTLVGANATISISGSGDVNLGTVSSNAGATFQNFTINAGELAGKLTVVTGAGNDTITAGSKGSDITAGAGADKITLGAGTDTVRVAAGDSGATVTATSISGIDTITGFQGGLGGDVVDFAGGTAVTYKALTGGQKTSVANANDLVEAANVIMAALDLDEATAFEFGGKTYVIADLTTDSATYNGTNDAIVELVGVSAADIGAANIL